jgi:aquaporin Z
LGGGEKDLLSGKQNSFTASSAVHSTKTAFQRHWRLYVDECVELAVFMISACIFSVWLFDPAFPGVHLFPDSTLRRLLMGMSMGATATLIIRSPMGKRSGAHFNPAITLTYFRLGKITKLDAGFYATSQFIGGILGVGLSALCLGSSLAVPTVDYVVTVPGGGGPSAAFCAEFGMATLLMLVVLWFSNRPPLAQYTSYLVGILIMFYVLVFAPVSGFSINPARTTGSAVFANVWTAIWLYFVAPVLGMMTSAEIYVRVYGIESILCAKLHPDPSYPCPFLCHFPLHRHPHEADFAVEQIFNKLVKKGSGES